MSSSWLTRSAASETLPETAQVHGRGSIGSISASLYKAFREHFNSHAPGKGNSAAGKRHVTAYRALRQRDAEVGYKGRAGSDNGSEHDTPTESDEDQSSNSSEEDLFKNGARNKWRRKMPRKTLHKMGNRTGASASCEDLVLDIFLPDEQMSAEKMDLKIQDNDLDLSTTLYRLRLPLPHPVNADRCHAKYDSELKKLRLTLRLRREFDFVNF